MSRGNASVTVTLVDSCWCPSEGRLIDLYSDAFLVLGRLSLGVLKVQLELL